MFGQGAGALSQIGQFLQIDDASLDLGGLGFGGAGQFFRDTLVRASLAFDLAAVLVDE